MNKVALKNNFEYFLFRGLSGWLRSISLTSALYIHRILGIFWYNIIKVRRNVTSDNLKHSFPEKTEKELNQLAKNVFFHFSRVAIEHILMPKLIHQGMGKYIGSANWNVLEKTFAEKKGVLVLSGHFGNWEILASVIPLKGFPFWAVAAEQRNKKIDNMINEHRNLAGIKLILRHQAKTAIPKIFKNGEIVLLLCDQDAGKNGIFVPFFGRLASTPPGPAVYSIRNKVPIVYATTIFFNGKYDLYFERLNFPEKTGGFKKNIKQITASHANRLERDIRRFPEQWLWLHKRWKTPPDKGESFE